MSPPSANANAASTAPSTAALTPSAKRASVVPPNAAAPGSPELALGRTDTRDKAETTTTSGGGTITAKNVASPGELCGFVDTLLNTLESRFDEMSEQVLTRMNDMGVRIDNLETAISDLMHSSPDSPTPKTK